MKDNMSRRKAAILAIVVCSYFSFDWVYGRIVVNVTESLDKNVFWRTGETPSSSGDYGLFIYPSHPYLASRGVEGERFSKRVGCMEGDDLRKDNGVFYCNGKPIAKTLNPYLLGEDLPVFSYSGIIPKNKAFMVGDDPFSGDSRYLGFVSVESVERIIPLW